MLQERLRVLASSLGNHMFKWFQKRCGFNVLCQGDLRPLPDWFELEQVVLLWDMVDNSNSLCNPPLGWFFRHGAVQTGHLFPKRDPIQHLVLAHSPPTARHDTSPASGLRGAQAETGGNGHESTSHVVHRRFVLPAAIAGVRCR